MRHFSAKTVTYRKTRNKMKRLTLIFCFLFPFISFSQTSSTIKIDTSNYYDKLTHNPMSCINHLRESDAVPIIIEELKKNGYSYVYTNSGMLIDNGYGQNFVINVGYSHYDTIFGFIWLGEHNINLNKKSRLLMSQQNKLKSDIYQHVSVSDTTDNCLKDDLSKSVKIKSLPRNIFILYQDCYFYEEDIADENIKYPLSKEVISNILRQDIRAFLKKVKFKK